jgi:phage repressor protein C with HTH and peptisase S24 domain
MKAAGTSDMFFPMGKLADRIRFVRKQYKMSQERFAEALSTIEGIKVTRGAVGNWELGGEISRANLAAIAERFKVNLDWLEFGKGEMPLKSTVEEVSKAVDNQQKTSAEHHKIAHNAVIGPHVAGFGRIPIRGQGMGGSEGILIFNDQNFGDILAPPALADIPDAYAVYVVGDSMLERYQHGEVVYVHPYVPVRKNDDCVIQISSGEGQPPIGYIKRFVSYDEKTLKVRQLNPPKVMTFPRDKVISVHRIVMGGPA